MTSATLGFWAVVVLLPLILVARLAVQSHRGTLKWSAELPLIALSPLIVAVFALITFGGKLVSGVTIVLFLVSLGLYAWWLYGRTDPAKVDPRWLRGLSRNAFIAAVLTSVALVLSELGMLPFGAEAALSLAGMVVVATAFRRPRRDISTR